MFLAMLRKPIYCLAPLLPYAPILSSFALSRGRNDAGSFSTHQTDGVGGTTQLARPDTGLTGYFTPVLSGGRSDLQTALQNRIANGYLGTVLQEYTNTSTAGSLAELCCKSIPTLQPQGV
jgi:hypothetical protein